MKLPFEIIKNAPDASICTTLYTLTNFWQREERSEYVIAEVEIKVIIMTTMKVIKSFEISYYTRRMLDSVVYTNGLNDSDLKSLLRRWKKRRHLLKKKEIRIEDYFKLWNLQNACNINYFVFCYVQGNAFILKSRLFAFKWS